MGTAHDWGVEGPAATCVQGGDEKKLRERANVEAEEDESRAEWVEGRLCGQ